MNSCTIEVQAKTYQKELWLKKGLVEGSEILSQGKRACLPGAVKGLMISRVVFIIAMYKHVSIYIYRYTKKIVFISEYKLT